MACVSTSNTPCKKPLFVQLTFPIYLYLLKAKLINFYVLLYALSKVLNMCFGWKDHHPIKNKKNAIPQIFIYALFFMCIKCFNAKNDYVLSLSTLDF